MKKNNYVVSGKLTNEEYIKERSNFLRGTIAHDLKDKLTNGFNGDNYSLIRFHGMYQQDDRDCRKNRTEQKLEPKYSMMLRCRLPGGIIKTNQWLEINKFVNRNTLYKTIRLTNRQTFQIHGILKKDLKLIHRLLSKLQLDSLATANDVNRNVLCTSEPNFSNLHSQVYLLAKKISEHLLPKTKAYAEIWLGQKKIYSNDQEIILGKTYLPRKFKTAIMIPPINDVDIHANDMVFIIIERNNKIVGCNLLLGGGLSITPGNSSTWPSCALEFGYFKIDKILIIAESVISIQRDWGNRTNRKNAKLRYTIDRVGYKNFKKEIENRSGIILTNIKKYKILSRGDSFGWVKNIHNNWNLTLFIKNGRICDNDEQKLMTGLLKIASIHNGKFCLTANQNLIISNIEDKKKKKIQNILDFYKLSNTFSKTKLNAMSCVSFPTCPLAMAESERILPYYIKKIERILFKEKLLSEDLSFRISGCSNGCGRSLLSEIGLIGRSLGYYDLYIGGNKIGTRIAKIYRVNISEKEIFRNVKVLVSLWAKNKFCYEQFGDFVIRFGLIK